MKKRNWLHALAALLIAISILTFTACSQQNTSTAASSSVTSSAATADQSTIYGKVTAVNGTKVTLALGTLNQSAETAPGSNNAPQGNPPAKPDDNQQGNTAGNGGTTSGSNNAPQGTPPAKPGDNQQGSTTGDSASGSNAPQGTPPSGGPGNAANLVLTGATKTITIADTSVITKQSMEAPGGSGTVSGSSSGSASSGNAASLTDIAVGSILKVTYNASSDALVSVQIMSDAGGAAGGGSSSGSPSITGTGAYTKTGTASNQTITASNSNESGVKITSGGILTLTDSTITTSGKTTSEEKSNFYGLNAAVQAQDKSSVTLKNTTITTTGDGANAIFAYGSGTSIKVDNVTINTSGDSSRGLDATYGGTVTANNVKISTKGIHCAALATDRGEGTVTVTDSTAVTAGKDSPAIYSTGTISASNSTLTATGAQALVVEGKNSITLTDCTATGYKENGVMMYQSFSGDAATGTSKLNITGGSLTAKAGSLFFITNTDAEITLNHTALTGTGSLLSAAATSRWGTAGSNGGTVKLTANSQTLSGTVTADKISSVTLVLNQSALTSTLNKENTAKVMSLTLDKSSTWNVTGTSYLTALTDADTTLSNIKDNGNTIYYDSANSANSCLNGKTIKLAGGGQLTPAK
ncbi:MAG TPA: right-handed parallel beta-helix repeat-containing protein [Caproiciproducens sp.]|nr:right-handed parallel beta-helix repeat-containing protein [Caproiciproducens sp.]